MNYAIVYSSRTGNTKRLAEALRDALPPAQCVYFGEMSEAATSADRLYIGFWTDKGTCDSAAADFLAKVRGKEVFLFGTAGFGEDPVYFEKILKTVRKKLDAGNTVIGSYMCQGKMPISVRERYEKMLAAPVHMPNLKGMIENFDKALSHPDEADLERLKRAVKAL